VGRPRVHHQAGGGAAVRAGGDQLQFAAAALLRGGAEEPDPAGRTRLAEGRGQAEEGGQARAGNQVVAAGVTYSGQCVILGVEDHQPSARTDLDGKGGLQPVGVWRRDKAQLPQGQNEGVVRLVLFVRQLGVCVNL